MDPSLKMAPRCWVLVEWQKDGQPSKEFDVVRLRDVVNGADTDLDTGKSIMVTTGDNKIRAATVVIISDKRKLLDQLIPNLINDTGAESLPRNNQKSSSTGQGQVTKTYSRMKVEKSLKACDSSQKNSQDKQPIISEINGTKRRNSIRHHDTMEDNSETSPTDASKSNSSSPKRYYPDRRYSNSYSKCRSPKRPSFEPCYTSDRHERTKGYSRDKENRYYSKARHSIKEDRCRRHSDRRSSILDRHHKRVSRRSSSPRCRSRSPIFRSPNRVNGCGSRYRSPQQRPSSRKSSHKVNGHSAPEKQNEMTFSPEKEAEIITIIHKVSKIMNNSENTTDKDVLKIFMELVNTQLGLMADAVTANSKTDKKLSRWIDIVSYQISLLKQKIFLEKIADETPENGENSDDVSKEAVVTNDINTIQVTPPTPTPRVTRQRKLTYTSPVEPTSTVTKKASPPIKVDSGPDGAQLVKQAESNVFLLEPGMAATKITKPQTAFKNTLFNGELRNLTPDKDDMVTIGPNGTKIPYRSYRSIEWGTYTIAVRKLLVAVFPGNILGTHSLTGQQSPAFSGVPAKKQLDSTIISDIVHIAMANCNVTESAIRSVITTKCADECKMYRMRIYQQHVRDQRPNSNQENLPPPNE